MFVYSVIVSNQTLLFSWGVKTTEKLFIFHSISFYQIMALASLFNVSMVSVGASKIAFKFSVFWCVVDYHRVISTATGVTWPSSNTSTSRWIHWSLVRATDGKIIHPQTLLSTQDPMKWCFPLFIPVFYMFSVYKLKDNNQDSEETSWSRGPRSRSCDWDGGMCPIGLSLLWPRFIHNVKYMFIVAVKGINSYSSWGPYYTTI